MKRSLRKKVKSKIWFQIYKLDSLIKKPINHIKKYNKFDKKENKERSINQIVKYIILQKKISNIFFVYIFGYRSFSKGFCPY